jgi:hypothetical protein
MNKKKETKAKTNEKPADGAAADSAFGRISSKAELKTFLNSIRDKVTEGVAAPIYAMSAMNFVLTIPDIYSLLDNENKEIARDIWLRLKQSGLQIRMPGLLFGADEIDGAAAPQS